LKQPLRLWVEHYHQARISIFFSLKRIRWLNMLKTHGIKNFYFLFIETRGARDGLQPAAGRISIFFSLKLSQYAKEAEKINVLEFLFSFHWNVDHDDYQILTNLAKHFYFLFIETRPRLGRAVYKLSLFLFSFHWNKIISTHVDITGLEEFLFSFHWNMGSETITAHKAGNMPFLFSFHWNL